jgi:hypothetical protein
MANSRNTAMSCSASSSRTAQREPLLHEGSPLHRLHCKPQRSLPGISGVRRDQLHELAPSDLAFRRRSSGDGLCTTLDVKAFRLGVAPCERPIPILRRRSSLPLARSWPVATSAPGPIAAFGESENVAPKPPFGANVGRGRSDALCGCVTVKAGYAEGVLSTSRPSPRC